MSVYTVIIAEPKNTHIQLPKMVANNLRHEVDFNLKHNEFLA